MIKEVKEGVEIYKEELRKHSSEDLETMESPDYGDTSRKVVVTRAGIRAMKKVLGLTKEEADAIKEEILKEKGKEV